SLTVTRPSTSTAIPTTPTFSASTATPPIPTTTLPPPTIAQAATAEGTAATTSDYTFTVQKDTPIYTANFTSSGCAFEGIAGQVFDRNNAPLTGMEVYVFASDGSFNESSRSGSSTTYGKSGWSVQTGTKPSTSQYTVQVFDSRGNPISDKATVH